MKYCHFVKDKRGHKNTPEALFLFSQREGFCFEDPLAWKKFAAEWECQTQKTELLFTFGGGVTYYTKLQPKGLSFHHLKYVKICLMKSWGSSEGAPENRRLCPLSL